MIITMMPAMKVIPIMMMLAIIPDDDHHQRDRSDRGSLLRYRWRHTPASTIRPPAVMLQLEAALDER
jgi:hypothetical protein